MDKAEMDAIAAQMRGSDSSSSQASVGPSQQKMSLKETFFTLFLFSLLLLFFTGTYQYLPPLLSRLKETLLPHAFRILFITGIFCLGGFLFGFYSRARKYFGLSEVAFALVTAWYAVPRLKQGGMETYLAMLAAAYLVATGLTHFQHGRKRRINSAMKRI